MELGKKWRSEKRDIFKKNETGAIAGFLRGVEVKPDKSRGLITWAVTEDSGLCNSIGVARREAVRAIDGGRLDVR